MNFGEKPRHPNTVRTAVVSGRTFVALILAATLVRAAAFGSSGTPDVMDFVVWTYHGTTNGPLALYGAGPVNENVSGELEYDGRSSTPDYPPMALYELSAAGTLYRLMFGEFDNSLAIVRLVKWLATVGDALIACLIFIGLRRRWGSGAARWGALAYWANPAVILHSSVLGYVGSLAAAPAIASLLLAISGSPIASGALLAVAGLTKPQGLFVAPAVAAALMFLVPAGRPARSALVRGLAGGAIVSALIVLPFILKGTFANMLHAVVGLVTDGVLSGWAANFWWLVSGGTMMEVADVLNIRSAPRVTGVAVVAAVSWTAILVTMVWAFRVSRRVADESTVVALAALTVHTYFVFGIHVHENHMWDVLPLLVLVAASSPAYRWLLAALSAVIFLNLNIFYGFGENVGYALPRSATLVDASLLLAVANIAAWLWHVRLFAERCRIAPAHQAAGPPGLAESWSNGESS